MSPENPYITGNPVGKSTTFIGRTDILQAVSRVLRHSQDNAIVLYGQRRMGKTSVLQALEVNLLKENCYYPVAFNLIDKAQESLEQVLPGLALQISQALSIAPPHFEHDPKTTFHQWLSQVLNQPSEQILVLLFDEFDVLDEPNNMRESFFPYLRDLLAINPQRFKFVFTIGRKIEELNTIALSLFKGIPSQRVSLLDNQETTQLVRLSETNQTLSWSNEAIDKIWSWTHGHPHLTQRFCSSVWDDIYDQQHTQLPTATLTDVDTAFPKVLNASRSSLEWLWDALPPTERVIVSALAQAKSVVKTEADLEALLRQSGVHVQIMIRDLQNALHLLQNWDLIELTTVEGYCFRVELIRFWIAKFKPPAQTQEELDQINPAANSLYKTARQLYQDHHIKEAEDTLRLALQSNPDHLGANLLLADILVERKQFKEVIEILEKHHEYSPASHRLISALLALAQSNQSKKAQRKLYQRILKIVPNHAEAQKQLANMQQWRQSLNWKRPLLGFKHFFNHYAKRTLEVLGFILALWFSYYWLGERLPTNPLIVFEIEQASDLAKYSITGGISDKPYILELVKI
jgi:tetratricopeptide (TPR) repeat protein